MRRLTPLLALLLVLALVVQAVAAFPTTSVLDAFTRANESPIAAPWISQTVSSASLRINSNAVNSDSAGNFGFGLYTNSGAAIVTPQTGSGIETFFTFSSNTAATRVGLLFTTSASTPPTDTPNGYQLDVQRASDTWRVARAAAGVNTALGADVTQVIATGDKVGWQIYTSGADTIVDVYYKAGAAAWALLFSRTDTGFTTYTVNGFVGAYVDSQTNTIDDFGGGNVVAAGSLFRNQGDMTGLRGGGKFFKDPAQ